MTPTNPTDKPKRISIKLKQPNPLFELWLKQWKSKAKDRGSKLHNSYAIALKSLQKYPLPLKTGKDCKVLYGFGDKLCSMLDKKLLEHNKANFENNRMNDNSPINNNSSPENNPCRSTILYNNTNTRLYNDVGKSETNQNNINSTVSKEATGSEDTFKSGAIAILVALYQCSVESNAESYLKSEITKNLLPGTKSLTWAQHMGTLISKHLVNRTGKPFKFSLTREGVLLAKELSEQNLINAPCSQSMSNPEIPECISDLVSDLNQELSNKNVIPSVGIEAEPCSSQTLNCNSNAIIETLLFPPNTFDIILYVDTKETGAIVNVHKDPFLIQLHNYGVLFEIKHLNVGDYTWICRDRQTRKELVLPYIVERKRLDDFADSIKDGRYHEQKYRLKKSGIQNIYYLIENFGKKQYTGLPVSTLQQAAINTVIQDGFYVKTTSNLSHTAKYLADFSKLMVKFFKSKTLYSTSKEDLKAVDMSDDLIPVMNFVEFNKTASKNKPITVSDLFVKMLLQIRGMSVDKALAIIEVYPTPLLLKKAYEQCDAERGTKLLSNIQFGKFKKKIGPQLSKILFQLFTFESFNSV